MYVDKKTIWQNDAGVVLSNAGNIFLEVGGDARTSWVPSETNPFSASPRDFSVAGNVGAVMNGETATAGVARPIDTFRGYPQHRLEHYFKIPVKGYTKLFFEWRGEHAVDSTGFALGGAGIPATFGRIWFYSKGRASAYGTFWEDDDLAYARRPFNMAWNSAHTDKLYGPPGSSLAGSDLTVNTMPFNAIGGMPLVVRPMTPFAAVAESTAFRYWLTPYNWARVPYGSGETNLTHGGLLWGYTQRNAGPVDASRYPLAGDKMGWVYEVGYPKSMSGFLGGQGSGSSAITGNLELTVAGLEFVYVAFRENGPVAGPNVYNPGAGNEVYWLDLATASITVRGRIKAIRIAEDRTQSQGV